MERSVTGTPSQGLAGATLGFFIGFAAVSLFGPTAKSLRGVLELSPLEVGVLVAAPSFSGSILRIPFAAWVDTTGGRKPFLVLLLLSIAGMAGLSFTLHAYYPGGMDRSFFPLILLLGVLCGCGIAIFSVGISQVAYWYPKARHGTALGTYAGVGNLAPGLFTLLLPFALVAMGLPGSYLAWLAFLALGTGLYAAVGRNAWYFQLVAKGMPAEQAREAAARMGQEIFPAGSVVDSLRISAGIWKTWALVAIYFTTFGGFIALTAWLPIYWTTFHSAGLVMAGALTAAFSISTSLIRVAGGVVSDRYGGERTLYVALGIMLAGSVLMTFAGSYGMALAAEVTMALGMGIANAAVFKLVAQEIPEAVGGAAGWIGGVGAFGGFAIPPTMALFVQAMGAPGYAAGFWVFVALALLSLLLLRVLTGGAKR